MSIIIQFHTIRVNEFKSWRICYRRGVQCSLTRVLSGAFPWLNIVKIVLKSREETHCLCNVYNEREHPNTILTHDSLNIAMCVQHEMTCCSKDLLQGRPCETTMKVTHTIHACTRACWSLEGRLGVFQGWSNISSGSWKNAITWALF